MKILAACAAFSLLAVPAFAQSSGTSGSTAPSTAATSSSASAVSNNPTAQKIKTDLQNAGFTDVNVVAEAFAVTAKSKDGNQVYMTFGPTGASIVESMPAGTAANGSQSHAGSGSGTTTK